MMRILFITKSSCLGNKNRTIHYDWIKEGNHNVQFWGKGFTDTSLLSLRKKIKSFKPKYIYMTMRNKYKYWLPDLTNIKVPKIFVEVDTFNYNRSDIWYKQFDKIYCRQAYWNPKSAEYSNILGNIEDFKKKLYFATTWLNTPVLHWSISTNCFPVIDYKRKHVRFVGNYKKPEYIYRKRLQQLLRQCKCKFSRVSGMNNYLELLHSTSALICPTESSYGDFVPAKLFEYLASGAAVLTNCNLKTYGVPELEKYVIKYNGIQDLKNKLKYIDFTAYHNKAKEIMKNHTHKIRYKELFGR